MACTVDDLLSSPFSSRSVQEKQKIISQGRPRPIINKNVSFNSKSISLSELYDLEIWLTVSENLCSIICWPCLLFPRTASSFYECYIGKITMKNLFQSISLHKSSLNHVNGLYEYRLFLKENKASNTYHEDVKIEPENNDERDNKILKRITEAVCLLVSNNSSLVKVTNAYSKFDIELFIQLLMPSENFDSSGVVEEIIYIIRKFPEVVKSTAKAVADVVKINLEKEIESSSYVSLIISEYFNSKLTLILRYLFCGNICERFIGFIDIQDYEMIKEFIVQIISDYKFSTKLISLSCDCGVLSPKNVGDLLKTLQKMSPSCFYVPCHLHDFSNVLEHRLFQLQGCQMFFKVLNGIKTFFQDNSGLFEKFQHFSKKNIPDMCNLKPSNAQFLKILKLYRRSFKTFFSHIAGNNEKMSQEEIAIVKGFQYLLEEYNIIFMIEAFYRLFNIVAVLCDILNSGSPEKIFDADILDNVEAALMKERTTGFEELWTIVVNELIEDCSPKSLQSVSKEETDALLELYSKAIDCTVEEIAIRFKGAPSLEFLSILNCESHNKLLISNYQKKLIEQIPENFLDKEQVIVEMKVLSKRGWLFGGKSAYELVDILTKMDLKDNFKNVYRLGEIILTLPCKPNPCSNRSSKLDAINSCSFKSNESEMNSLCFLHIEKDYLEQVIIKSQTDFYDHVIFKLLDSNNAVSEMFVNTAIKRNKNGK